MMNTLKKIMLILLVVVYFVSCQKKEIKNGIEVNAIGLKYDNIILRLNNDTLKTNEVDYEKDLIVNIFGLNGFNETVGNIYIGCSLVLTNESGKEIMKYKDLYSYYDVSGISSSDIKNKFSISISLQSPLKKGKTYTWKSKIWDKKGKGEINTEMTFKIKNSEVK